MSEVGDAPDYWRGYIRGLRRAYHSEQFGTEAEHELWSTLVDSEDAMRHEGGRGYLDGLRIEA